MAKDRVGISPGPGELVVSKSVPFPFSALKLLFWQQEGLLVCKKLDVGVLVVMI